MKQGKGICKHGPYVGAAFGLHETANEFLYFYIGAMIWARPRAQAQVQTSLMCSSETQKTQVSQPNSEMLWFGVLFVCF